MADIFTKEQISQALSQKHGDTLAKKLSQTCVAVCGLGGLGSNIAMMLTRAGIGKLILIDFDKVELTNLNRQNYFLSQTGMYKTQALADTLIKILPCTDIQTFNEKINALNVKKLLKEADIICEAFDDAAAKSMLADSIFTLFPEKYLVSASGMSGLGSPNDIVTRKITDKFYICGDGISDTDYVKEIFPSKVMLCAAHQVHTVLGIIDMKEGNL